MVAGAPRTVPQIPSSSPCASPPAKTRTHLQVALIVYLAHVGSFVPAASATVGLTDRILTRIVSQEQLALGVSSFCADLTQAGARAPASSLAVAAGVQSRSWPPGCTCTPWVCTAQAAGPVYVYTHYFALYVVLLCTCKGRTQGGGMWQPPAPFWFGSPPRHKLVPYLPHPRLLPPSQVVAMLHRATPRSLVVVDEFGKGTLTSVRRVCFPLHKGRGRLLMGRLCTAGGRWPGTKRHLQPSLGAVLAA